MIFYTLFPILDAEGLTGSTVFLKKYTRLIQVQDIIA